MGNTGTHQACAEHTDFFVGNLGNAFRASHQLVRQALVHKAGADDIARLGAGHQPREQLALHTQGLVERHQHAFENGIEVDDGGRVVVPGFGGNLAGQH